MLRRGVEGPERKETSGERRRPSRIGRGSRPSPSGLPPSVTAPSHLRSPLLIIARLDSYPLNLGCSANRLRMSALPEAPILPSLPRFDASKLPLLLAAPLPTAASQGAPPSYTDVPHTASEQGKFSSLKRPFIRSRCSLRPLKTSFNSNTATIVLVSGDIMMMHSRICPLRLSISYINQLRAHPPH